MLTRGFKIVSPKRFEVDIEQVVYKEGHSIVKIDNGCICKADLRYYLGNRDSRLLGLKYPMRLLHEATGTIIKCADDSFKIGDKVVLVPNVVKKCDICENDFCNDESLGENYCPTAKFASSNADGFSAEIISYPTNSLVKIPNDEEVLEVAVFSELISVAMAAIRRIKIEEHNTVAIWGDGIVGYILANSIRILYPKCKLVIVGKNIEKIERFPTDLKYDIVDEKQIKRTNIDIAFECVGGEGASFAINQIINCIKIGGKIVLTGVSENDILINSRKILEKGLIITGSTRSTKKDFEKAIELLQNKSFRNSIEELITEKIEIRNIVDYYSAFEEANKNRKLGKSILQFNL